MSFDVVVTGAGVVGALAVEFLARRPEIRSICVTDIDGKRAAGAAWRARVGAYQEGYDCRVEARTIDLSNVEAASETLAALKPGVVFHTATIVTVPEMAKGLSPEDFERVRRDGMAGFVPAHAYLAINLQAALRNVSPCPRVVMAPFPDFTIPILSHLGDAPLTGIGNVDNIASALACIVAEDFGVPGSEVLPTVVAHHAVSEWFSRTGTADKAPWFARVSIAGEDVTDRLDLNALMARTTARLRGQSNESRVASSAVRAILAILRDEGAYFHSAGANGLPGGWPVRLFADRAELVEIPGLGFDEALAINVAGQRASGLESIEDDGTLVYSETCSAMMDELFEVKLGTVAAADIAPLALEIRRCLSRRIAQRA